MWMLAGIALGAGLIFLIVWLRAHSVKVTWYEWVLGAVGMALVLFAYQNHQASIAELHPRVPGMFLLVFGLPGLLLLALGVFLPWYRRYKAGKKIEKRA